MNSSEVVINKTHICVLRKNGVELLVDKIPLEFEYSLELKELEILAANPNRTSYELEEFVSNSSLHVLLRNFNYCENLRGSYQGLGRYDLESYDSYLEEHQKQKSALLISFPNESNDLIQQKLNEKTALKRNLVLENITNRVVPYLLDKHNKINEQNQEIVAFSHRKHGFSFPEFQLNDDFKVVFKTNFGYGQSSYFYTNITYKGIELLPFSDWIRYRFADKADIIRYTRKYPLDNNSWLMTMNFTAELFNDSVNNPNQFIEKWIINECFEMVSGLELLLNRNKNHEIIQSYFFPNYRTTLVGFDLINFKGERISGALSFLDKMTILSEVSRTVPELIERVLSCNMSIYHQLNVEIIRLEKLTNEIIRDRDLIKTNLDLLKNESEKYESEKTTLFENQIRKYLSSQNNSAHEEDEKIISLFKRQAEERIKLKVDFEFNIKYPRYESYKNELITVQNEYTKLENKLRTNQNWLTRFNSYTEVIEKHFASINRNIYSNKLA